MSALKTNLLDWQKRCGTEETYVQVLMQQRLPEGLRCQRCGHDHGPCHQYTPFLRALQVPLQNLTYGEDTVSLHQSAAD